MSHQLALFARSESSAADGDFGYSVVIEALWKLHPSETDREEFFRNAQKRWAAVKDNEEEKRKIIEAARQVSDDRVRPAMVTTGGGSGSQPSRRVTRVPSPTNSSAASGER